MKKTCRSRKELDRAGARVLSWRMAGADLAAFGALVGGDSEGGGFSRLSVAARRDQSRVPMCRLPLPVRPHLNFDVARLAYVFLL